MALHFFVVFICFLTARPTGNYPANGQSLSNACTLSLYPDPFAMFLRMFYLNFSFSLRNTLSQKIQDQGTSVSRVGVATIFDNIRVDGPQIPTERCAFASAIHRCPFFSRSKRIHVFILTCEYAFTFIRWFLWHYEHKRYSFILANFPAG